MKALAGVLLFAVNVAAAFYAHAHHIGDAATLLAIAAAVSLFCVWDAIGDD